MATEVTTKRWLNDVDQYLHGAPPAVLEQFEKIGGRWRQREVAGGAHQRIGRRLANRFEALGFAAEGGVRVIMDDQNWVVPDTLVVSPTNPVQIGEGNFVGAPDLVVEVLAADNDHGEDLDKKLRYAAAGVRFYWLVRLKAPARVEAWRLVAGEYVFEATAPLEPLTALPVPPDL